MNEPQVKWDDEQPSKPQYAHTARHKKTGQRIGSNDGKTWYDLKTGEPYHAK